MPKQSTSYKGLVVNENEKNQLIGQPIGNFLRYEEDGDNYIIQQKFPNVGTFEGKDFNPQRGMNVFTKGLGNLFSDKNKIINFSEFEKKSLEINQIFTGMEDTSPNGSSPNPRLYNKCLDYLMKLLKVPSDEIENTKTFIKSIGKYAQKILEHCGEEVTKLRKFHTIVDKFNELPEDKKPLYKDYINKNKNGVINIQNRLFSLKDIDIDKNQKLVYSSDCITSSEITNIVANAYNNYCDSHDGYENQKINGAIQHLSLGDIKYDSEKEDIKFEEHHLYGVNITLNNKETYLTLETTAPEPSQLFHEPGSQKTGLGLYESSKDCLDYYKGINICDKVVDGFNYFKRKDSVNTLNPVVDQNEIESMKPKEPNAFFKFCHEYLHLFNNMFNEYHSELAKYEDAKSHLETLNNFSNDGNSINNGNREKVTINDPSLVSEPQKVNENEMPSMDNTKNLNNDTVELE